MKKTVLHLKDLAKKLKDKTQKESVTIKEVYKELCTCVLQIAKEKNVASVSTTFLIFFLADSDRFVRNSPDTGYLESVNVRQDDSLYDDFYAKYSKIVIGDEMFIIKD